MELFSVRSLNLILSIICSGALVFGLLLALLSVIYGLLWESSGLETLEVTPSSLQRQLAPAPLLGAMKKFDMKEITGIRTEFREFGEYRPLRQIDTWGYIMGRLPGQIAFDYRGTKSRIGNGLSEADAEELAELLTKKFG